MKIDAATLARWVHMLERARARDDDLARAGDHQNEFSDPDIENAFRELRQLWLRAEREEAK